MLVDSVLYSRASFLYAIYCIETTVYSVFYSMFYRYCIIRLVNTLLGKYLAKFNFIEYFLKV